MQRGIRICRVWTGERAERIKEYVSGNRTIRLKSAMGRSYDAFPGVLVVRDAVVVRPRLFEIFTQRVVKAVRDAAHCILRVAIGYCVRTVVVFKGFGYDRVTIGMG